MTAKRFCLSAIVLTALCFTAEGQYWQAYDFRLLSDPYLTSSNPAYISMFEGNRLAIAEMSAEKANGEIVSLSESSDSYEAGARSEAFVKVSERIAFYGKLSYSYFHGKNMGGQILMDPENNPINFLESSDTTLGVKVRESYKVVGGMSYRISPKLTAGVKFDYMSGDQTKTKDPRFLNYLMDLNVSAGISWAVTGYWDLGLAFRFRDEIESVKGHVYGTTDKQYSIYTDKGGFWGLSAQLDGDLNYMPTSTSRPLTGKVYGTALSFNRVASGLKLFNELSFDYRNGYYGDKISTKPCFFEFSGFSTSYDGSLLIESGKNLQKIGLDASYAHLSNAENSFSYVTEVGKETTVQYAGQTNILSRNDVSGKLSYTFLGNNTDFRPSTVIGASVEGFYRTQRTTVYPYYRDHSYCRYQVTLEGEKNFFRSDNIFTVGAEVLFRSGFGTPAEDGVYASGTTKMKSFDKYLYRQFEYETAMRAGAGLSLIYTRMVSDRLLVYVKLSDRFASLLKSPEYLYGRTRNVALLTLGCDF